MSRARTAALALALGIAFSVAWVAPANAYVDPPGCPTEVTFDSSIPTFEEVVGVPLGAGGTGSTSRNLTAQIYAYFDAVVDATADSDRVKVIRKSFGTSVLGRDLRFYVDRHARQHRQPRRGPQRRRVLGGRGRRLGPRGDGLAPRSTRPALRLDHRDAARLRAGRGRGDQRDALRARRAHRLREPPAARRPDLFLDPARNPDGRDADQPRPRAWGFDPNRDFGTRNQVENGTFMPQINQYPGLFFIDAHQQRRLLLPAQRGPRPPRDLALRAGLHPEPDRPGAAAGDQRPEHRPTSNYNTYDLFTPEYGDTVPSLIMGAAGMTYEKGNSEDYGKQVYDHYLAIDATINVTSRDKVDCSPTGSSSGRRRSTRARRCDLQPNKLVSPLHETIKQQPSGDGLRLLLQARPARGRHGGADARHAGAGRQRLPLDTTVNASGVHEFGAGARGETRDAARGDAVHPDGAAA